MDVALDHSNDDIMGMAVYKNKALKSPHSKLYNDYIMAWKMI